ncbi:MAG: hypothetical protein N3A54_02500 [Patescibacteria group bacterium]|nr:hypothetical protein [Patescibacteria group bacterium]
MNTVIDVYPISQEFDLSKYQETYIKFFRERSIRYTPTLRVVYDQSEGVYYTFEEPAVLKVILDYSMACNIHILKMSSRIPNDVADAMGWNPYKTIDEIFDYIVKEASKSSPYKITVEETI